MLRAEHPRAGYTWQIRKHGYGQPLETSDRVYASEVDARLAGERALEQHNSPGAGCGPSSVSAIEKGRDVAPPGLMVH